jgi:hypothetical protein
MAMYRPNLTSSLLTLAALVLACAPTTEETASDAAATDTTAATGTETTADSDSTTVVPGDTDSTAAGTDTTTTAGTDTTTGLEPTTTGNATDITGTDTGTDTDTGADACPAKDPALAEVGVNFGNEAAAGGDCAVVSASNAGGAVMLDLLCPEEVSIHLAVPTDFKVDLEGLTDVTLFVGGDPFFEGPSFVVHDLATGDFVLAAHQMNGFSTYPQLAPISLKEVGACGDDACKATYQIAFSHADGPSLALFPGSRDTLSAGGRDYDLVLGSAWESLCEEHVGGYTWIIGASASP